MKFNLEVNSGSYFIHSYQTGQVCIAQPIDSQGVPAAPPEALHSSLIVMPQQLLRDWPPQDFTELEASHFEVLLELRPELVLLGVGGRLRFPAPALTAQLTDHGIGVEVMDTGAACRTYNILMAEGRNVAGGL